MKNRNLIEDIIKSKERNNFSMLNSLAKIKEIDEAIEEISHFKKFPKELLKYIPVQSIALFQSYFRETISDLIDNEFISIENIETLLKSKNIKFEISTLNALNNKRFSLGELVAHFFTINNLKELNNIFSILLQEDFFRSLKEYPCSEGKVYGKENTYQFNFPEALNSINETFRLRNIICHEYSFETELDINSTKKLWKDVSLFICHCNLYFFNIKESSFSELNNHLTLEKVAETFKKENEELNIELDKIVEKIINTNDKNEFNIELFKKSIEKWKEYIDYKLQARWGHVKTTRVNLFFEMFRKKEFNKKIEDLNELNVKNSKESFIDKKSTHLELLKSFIEKEKKIQ